MHPLFFNADMSHTSGFGSYVIIETAIIVIHRFDETVPILDIMKTCQESISDIVFETERNQSIEKVVFGKVFNAHGCVLVGWKQLPVS